MLTFDCRLFVKDSLYDRISTRPFLKSIEKKFIVFQLLCALNQCHKLEVSTDLLSDCARPKRLVELLLIGL